MVNSGEDVSSGRAADEITIDLIPILKRATQNWDFTMLGTALFLVLGLVIGLMRTPQYTVQVVIAPKAEPPGTYSSGVAGGGAGGMMGGGSSILLNALGGGSSAPPSDFEQYRRLLISHATANIIAANPNIMHRLVPGWDYETKTWRRPSGLMFWLRESAKALLGRPLWTPPGPNEAFIYLQQKLTLTDELTGGFVDATMTDADPKFADEFIHFLHQATQQLVREDIRKDAIARIAYLNNSLQTVTQADQRSVLITLLGEEQQKLMMIEADKDLVAEVIDPAIIPKTPSSFSAVTIALLAGGLGLVLSTVTLIFVSEYRLQRVRDWMRRRTLDRLPTWQFR